MASRFLQARNRMAGVPMRLAPGWQDRAGARHLGKAERQSIDCEVGRRAAYTDEAGRAPDRT